MYGYGYYQPKRRALSEQEANLRYETLRRKEELVNAMYAAVEREVMAARRPNIPYLTALEEEVKERLAPVDERLRVLVNACDQYACAEREANEARRMLGRTNPKKNRRNGKATSHSAALAKGQALMAQAQQAFHAGRYPTMSAALKGVARKNRR
jgi:hypothetical protein